MVELKHIGVMSAAKIGALTAAVVAVAGAIIGFVLNAAGIYGLWSPATVPGCSWGLWPGSASFRYCYSLHIDPDSRFIVFAIIAWLYNVIAGKVGGLIVTFTGGKLSNIDPLRAAIIATILALIVMIVYGIIFGSLFGALAAQATGFAGAAAGGLLTLVAVFVIAIPILTFITTAIGAFLYNIFAKSVGGIVVKFNKDELVSIGPLSYAIMAALIGIFTAIISTVIAYVGLSTFLSGLLSSFLPTTAGLSFNLTASALIMGFVIGVVFTVIQNFITAGLTGVVYNWWQTKVGGVSLTFK